MSISHISDKLVIEWLSHAIHCESVRIRSYSGPHFSAFGVNIQSECGKIQTRITPNTDTFNAVIWPVSSIFIFRCYITRIKAYEIRQQNIRNSEVFGHILLANAITNAWLFSYITFILNAWQITGYVYIQVRKLNETRLAFKSYFCVNFKYCVVLSCIFRSVILDITVK